MTRRIAQEKSFALSVAIIKICNDLGKAHKYELSNQLLRSATSIGANLAEADYAQSDADLLSKISISLKETSETIYWLKLLKEVHYISNIDADNLISRTNEILKILISARKTLKNKLNNLN